MELGVYIRNLLLIGVVIGVAFLSQMPWLASNSANFAYSQGMKSENSYAAQAGDWIQNNVLGKLGGGVGTQIAKTQDIIASAAQSTAQAVENKKNDLIKTSTDDTKKFIATEFLKALGVTPQDLGATSCPANPTN
mgnify:FL=1